MPGFVTRCFFLLLSCMTTISFAQAQGGCFEAGQTTSITIVGTPTLRQPSFGVPPVASASSNSISTAVSFADIVVTVTDQLPLAVYDSLGALHSIFVAFYLVDSSNLDVRVYVLSEEVNSGGFPIGYPREAGSGILTFDQNGRRTNSPGAGASDILITAPWKAGSEPASIDLRLEGITLTEIGGYTDVTIDGFSPRRSNSVIPAPTLTPEKILTLSANLDSSSPLTTGMPTVPLHSSGSPSMAVSFADLRSTGQFWTSVDEVDSTGATHHFHIFFFKVGMNFYTANVYVDSSDIGFGLPAGYPRLAASVDLVFDSFGRLANSAETTAVGLNWSNGIIESIGFRFGSMTQLAAEPGVCGSRIDYCPSEEFGACGCRVLELDEDLDGVADCTQFSSSTVPSAPAISKRSKRRIQFSMQEFLGKHRFRFVLISKEGKRRTFLTRRSHIEFSDLPRGRYRGYYFVERGLDFGIKSSRSIEVPFSI